MRRALLAILLASIAWVSVASAWAATSPETIRTILRDCEDDGSLSGSYRPSELRDAVRNIGTDLDQYSDCRDVISAAVLRAVSRPRSPGPGGTTSANGTESPGGGLGTDGAGAAGEEAASGGADFGGGALLTPDGPEEVAELSRLRAAAPPAALVGGEPVDLSGARSLAAIVAHELPTPLLVALALLTVGALVAGLPSLRRRVLDRRAA